MLSKWFKISLVILSLIAMVSWSVNYKNKSDAIQQNGYALYFMIENLTKINHAIRDDILRASLYRFYSNDIFQDHVQQLINQIQSLQKSNIYYTSTYPKTKKIIDDYINYKEVLINEIELFKRKNGQIKNSIIFITSSLKNMGNLSKENNQKLLDVMSSILSIKNSMGENREVSLNLNLDFLETSKAQNEVDKKYIELYKAHIDLLKKELPSYLILVNSLVNNEHLENQLHALSENIKKENTNAVKSLDFEYYSILLYGFLTMSIIVYYIFLTENEKQKISKLQDDYKKSVTIDSITGVKNRTAYLETLKSYDNATVVLFDISEFSSINNLYGIAVGDFILKCLGDDVSKEIKKIKNAELFKVGADQFLILMDQTDNTKAFEIAKTILTGIEKNVYTYDEVQQPISIQLQAGISDTSPLLINALLALKTTDGDYSKKIGIYDNSLNKTQKIKKNIHMIQKIKRAINNDNIAMLFQPIIDLKTKKIIKHESLVRIKDKDEYISPYFFLELSKKAKLYTQITHEVILKSIDAVKLHDIDISINLSIEDILHQPTHDFILLALQNNSSITSKITFEILESEEILDFQVLKEFIKKIKSFGCLIAIDDFGSGYSNYNYLLELDIDILKIDGSLIKNIDKSENNQLVVKSIIEFAKLANIKTIAEFVSSSEIEKVVIELGVDYGQGYYYSAPKLL